MSDDVDPREASTAKFGGSSNRDGHDITLGSTEEQEADYTDNVEEAQYFMREGRKEVEYEGNGRHSSLDDLLSSTFNYMESKCDNKGIEEMPTDEVLEELDEHGRFREAVGNALDG